MDYTEEYIPITIICPESGKVYSIMRGDDFTEQKANSLTELLTTLFEKFEKEREEALERLQTPGTSMSNKNPFKESDTETDDVDSEEETVITPDGNGEDEEMQVRFLFSISYTCRAV